MLDTWLAQNDPEDIENAAKNAIRDHPRMFIEVDHDSPPAPVSPRSRDPDLPAQAAGLSERYTFDTFVVGNSNQFAQAACQAVRTAVQGLQSPVHLWRCG